MTTQTATRPRTPARPPKYRWVPALFFLGLPALFVAVGLVGYYL